MEDKKLFVCPKNKGIFVSIDKLEAKLNSLLLQEYAKQSALGLAPSCTFKITFVGPEGSGKTSSIKTLLGKKFDNYEQSTIGAILGIQAIIKWFKGNENTEDETSFELQSSHAIGWRETSTSDVQEVLEKEYVKEMSSKLISQKYVQSMQRVTVFAKNSAGFSNSESDSDSDFIEVDAADDSDGDEPSNTEDSSNTTQVTETYSSAKKVMFGEKVDTLDNHASISDFAGQLTFFSFQLFFLKKRDVVTITFNASVVLTAKIIARERYDHVKKKREVAGMMTTIENIHFWMKSVSAHAGTDDVPKGCISRRSPTAILCATHAEKLSAAQMEYVTKTVMDSLKGKPYRNHLPTDPTKAIMFVSNKNRKKFAKNIMKFRNIIMEAATPAYSEERPISYLRLEQFIRTEVEKGSNIISVVEFTILVNRAGIPGNENSEAVAAALQYCTTRGTILYFPEVEILAEKVFISPQWLSSIFAQIITTHKQESTDSLLYYSWKRYDTFAILEEHFLDHILMQASVMHLKEIIISLMQSFNLLTQIPTNTCFAGESTPPPLEGKVFIVPALLLYDPQLAACKPKEQDQVYMYYFTDLYFPESAFNQILVKMICWNAERSFQIIRYVFTSTHTHTHTHMHCTQTYTQCSQ